MVCWVASSESSSASAIAAVSTSATAGAIVLVLVGHAVEHVNQLGYRTDSLPEQRVQAVVLSGMVVVKKVHHPREVRADRPPLLGACPLWPGQRWSLLW